MLKDLSVKAVIEMDHEPARVWDALVNPEKIKSYLFGTNTTADWREGGSITFTGSYEGKEYRDGGRILRFIPESILEYNYHSSMSPLPDLPENYSVITFQIDRTDRGTRLTLTHRGFADESSRDHSEENWKMVLQGIDKAAAG